MSAGKFLAGFIVGGAIGAIAGILLAPKSGEETRALIADSAKDAVRRADETVKEIQSKADDVVLRTLGLERLESGYLSTNDNDQTSDEKIFAAGDLTGTKSTVAWACRKGRDAAYSIIEYLENK